MSGLPSELLHTLTGHEGAVLNVRFNPKGNYCISCGKVGWPTYSSRQHVHLSCMSSYPNEDDVLLLHS